VRKELEVSKEASSFFAGFCVGALVGGAAALLTAPQTGEETRSQIRDRSIEIKEKAEATYGDVLTRIDSSTTELRGRTEELSSKLDQLIAQGKQEITRLKKRGAEVIPTVEEVEEAVAEA
jgi:gas vesicle protein